MSQIVAQLTSFAQQVILTIGYPGIFLLVIIENFVGPLPMPPILPLGGMLAAQGKLNFFGVWFAAVAGALIGALALYGVGVWVDERVIRRFIRRYGRYLRLSEVKLDRALALFKRYGGAAIVVGRMLPVVRNFVSLTAGMSRLPVPQFLFFTALTSTPSIGIWVYGGYILGENWPAILDVIRQYEPLILVVLALAGVIGIVIMIWRVWRNHQSEILG